MRTSLAAPLRQTTSTIVGVALIGDPERERAAAFLRHCYVQGRISVEELAERLDLALRARRESDMRVALAELPGTWRAQAAVTHGLESLWQGARRVAFLVLVWSLWWAASIVLLIGFVASLVATGLSLVNAVAFPVLWLACTLAARHVARKRR
jgi:hypothetical protein